MPFSTTQPPIEVSHSKPARAQRSQLAYRLNFNLTQKLLKGHQLKNTISHSSDAPSLRATEGSSKRRNDSIAQGSYHLSGRCGPHQQQNATTEDMLDSPYMDNRSPPPYSVCIPFWVPGTPASLLHKHRAFSTSTSRTAEREGPFCT